MSPKGKAFAPGYSNSVAAAAEGAITKAARVAASLVRRH